MNNKDNLNFYMGLNITFKFYHLQLHILTIILYHFHRKCYNLLFPLCQLMLWCYNKVYLYWNNNGNLYFYTMDYHINIHMLQILFLPIIILDHMYTNFRMYLNQLWLDLHCYNKKCLIGF